MRKILLLLGAVVCLSAQDKPAAMKKPGLPLKPERKIEFTTDEGTWLSVDVSPDGGTILFDLVGDLYTVPIAGGEAKRITSGMAFDSQPKYSPDGKTIAFLSDRDGAENLWIAGADGSGPKQLSKMKQSEFASPAWTPDGQYVLVSRTTSPIGAHEIWMYNVHGGTGVQVTKSAENPRTPRDQRLNCLGAAVSPDGKFLFYAQRKRDFSYNVEFPLWQIYRKDLVTGEADVITDAPESAFRPVISPNGKLMAYGTRFEAQTGLRIRNFSTGEDRWLKYPVQRDDQESRATRDVLPGYSFTPDSRSVVVSYGGKIHRVDAATGADALIPFNAAVSLDIGPQLKFASRVDQGPVKARLIQGAVQSPDGKRLAFSSLTHLYVMDLPGGQPKRLVPDGAGEYEPAWAPDGYSLAYVTWTGETGGQIWRVRADGSAAPQQLTHVAAYYEEPVWAPDASRIVCLRASMYERNENRGGFGDASGTDLVWVPAQGGDAQLITPARGFSRPHFIDGSDRIYVYAHAKGLLSLRFDGTDRRPHLKVITKNYTGAPEPPPVEQMMFSPDGKQALALAHHELYLLSVPVLGGDGPTVDLSAPSVPIKRLTDVGADTFAWADDGKTITWSLGASFFRQPLSTVVFDPEKKEGDEADDKPKPKAPPKYEELAVDIEAPRYTPKGTVVLRGATVITMRGEEVIPNADIIVTDNRIVSVGKRGAAPIPAGAKILDVKGETIMPGIVDVHAHWTEIRRGVLDVQSWPFMANLAFGVTTGRDPQTGTNDMFAYQDLIDMGQFARPARLFDGPRYFRTLRQQRHSIARRHARHRRPLQKVLPHQYGQVLPCRQPPAAAMDGGGEQGERHHADDGRRSRPEARFHPCHRRLRGQRTCAAHCAALQGRRRGLRQIRHLLYADASGGLWRPVGRKLFLYVHRGA